MKKEEYNHKQVTEVLQKKREKILENTNLLKLFDVFQSELLLLLTMRATKPTDFAKEMKFWLPTTDSNKYMKYTLGLIIQFANADTSKENQPICDALDKIQRLFTSNGYYQEHFASLTAEDRGALQSEITTIMTRCINEISQILSNSEPSVSSLAFVGKRRVRWADQEEEKKSLETDSMPQFKSNP